MFSNVQNEKGGGYSPRKFEVTASGTFKAVFILSIQNCGNFRQELPTNELEMGLVTLSI